MTTDISKWGTVTKQEENVITLENSNYPGTIIVIKLHSDKQLYQFLINGKVKFYFEDIYGSNEESFTRVIREMQTLHVQDGKVVLKTNIIKVNFFNKEKVCNRIQNNFLTLDIETREIRGVLSPYCISIYDGTKSWSFYLDNYKSIEKMIEDALSSIMKIKYNGWNVYIHNGS